MVSGIPPPKPRFIPCRPLDTALGEATIVLETLFMTTSIAGGEVPGQLCLNLSLPLILGAPEGFSVTASPHPTPPQELK